LLNFIESFHQKVYCVEVFCARLLPGAAPNRNPVEQQPTGSGISFAGNTPWQCILIQRIEGWKKELGAPPNEKAL
jgi:hypothetical protein